MSIKKYIFAISILFIFTTCAKRTELKIIGSWDVVDVGQPAFSKDATWTFYSGDKLSIFKDLNADPKGTTEATWEAFNRSAVIRYIEIKGTGAKAMDGKWRVEKLNKKYLVITRVEFGTGETAGAFLRREFKRK